VNFDCYLKPYLFILIQSGLQRNYGMLAYRYAQLIISKLKFHERNPAFSGNLNIAEHNDIRRLFNDDFNSYFQLCVELFDYMEEILSLVQVIFTSLDQSRSNSMTSAGQCRLNPLIVCIQDSSLLYDYVVKVLFKLHEGTDELFDFERKLFFWEKFRFTS
jgi:huntingtin interacting protein 1